MNRTVDAKHMPNIENLSEEEIIRLENAFLQNNCTGSGKSKPLTKLWKMCKGYYGKLLLSALFCVLQLSASLFLPIATSNIINALTERTDDSARIILTNLGVAVFLLLINYPMQHIYRQTRDDAARSIEAALRGSIVTKLQNLTIQFSKEMESGRIQSKIMRDVEAIHNLLVGLHTNGIHILVNLTVTLAVLVIKGNWEIILFFLICGPLAVFTARLFKKGLVQNSSRYRRSLEETNARVVDMVGLIPVTKAHALEGVEIEKMSRQIISTAKIGYALDSASNKFTVINWLIMQAFQVLCLILTSYMVFTGRMAIGDLTLYQSYFSTFVSYISSMTNLIPTIASGSEAINSVNEILDSSDVEDNHSKRVLKEFKGNYELRDVTFRYRDGNKPILQHLNLTVNAGETVALVGESGSGKSTIINLITGFNFCSDGAVLVDGVDIKELDLRAYRKHIAVVLQNSILFSGSIRDNITYGSPHVSEEYLQKIIDLACLRDVIDSLPEGLNTLVGEQGNRLSGGQRQRISIARALIRNPQVIIFDEATSALDTVSEKHIQTAIDNLSKDKTTFIVAHRLSTIKNADKIAVIKDGHCVEFGTYNELLEKKGEFYRFRQMQV